MTLYRCVFCDKEKPFAEFVKRNNRPKNCKQPYCKSCHSAKRRAHRNELRRALRHRTKNASDRKYHHTIKGYLVRQHRNMRSRCNGINKKYAHLYFGKECLPREVFYTWALNNPDYVRLFEQYKASGWNTDLAPSVDRRDSDKGYTLDNIRYMTLQENRERGLENGRAVQQAQREEVSCPF